MSGGGSKEQTIGYKYRLGMQVGLCLGPIDKITRISFDNKLAWDGECTGGPIIIDKPDLYGGETREGGVSGTVDIEMGAPDQAKNDYLVSQLGSSISAFRGVVTAVFRNFYFGMNPYLKRFSCRGQRVYVRQEGIDQWYPDKAGIPIGEVYSYDGLWKYRVVSAGDGGAIGIPAEYIEPEYDDAAWAVGKGGFGSGGPGAGLGVGTYVPAGEAGRAVWIRKEINFDDPAYVDDVHLSIFHDDGAFVWWNGVAVEIEQQENYFYSTAVIPRSLVQKNNVVVVQVLDTIPEGSTFNIYAGLTVSVGTTAHLDMNPSHLLRECFTDPDWGLRHPEIDMGDSFTAAADTLYDERMGISIRWTKEAPLEDFMDEIKKHINAETYVDRQTAKIEIKLIRPDYDEESLLVLDDSNIEGIDFGEAPAFGEFVTSLTADYWNYKTGKKASVTVHDPALIIDQGANIHTTRQFPGFTNPQVATMVALRELAALGKGLKEYTIYSDRKAKSLNPGDPFIVDSAVYGINNVVMRVKRIYIGNSDKNRLKIIVIEDAFSTPNFSTVAASNNDTDTDYVSPEPIDVPEAQRLVIEAPYYEVAQVVGDLDAENQFIADPESGFVIAAAGRVPGAINANLWVDAGAGYQDAGILDFCPHGELSVAVSRNPLETDWVLENVSALENVQVGTHAQVGNELVRVDSVDIETGAITVGRGVLDTLPAAHMEGDIVMFWDVYASASPTVYVHGELLSVKITPLNGSAQLGLSDATANTVQMASRAVRPYPPANVQINTTYEPEIVAGPMRITWSHRDRLLQTGNSILDYTAASVGPEAGTTYNVYAYDNTTEDLLHSASEVTDAEYIIPPLGLYEVRIELESVRDGYSCLQKYVHVLNVFGGTGHVDVVSENAGALILESGETLVSED